MVPVQDLRFPGRGAAPDAEESEGTALRLPEIQGMGKPCRRRSRRETEGIRGTASCRLVVENLMLDLLEIREETQQVDERT